MPPGLAAVAGLLRAACRRVNTPVVFLCFYFAAQLSRRSRAACRVACKCSFTMYLLPLIGSAHAQNDPCILIDSQLFEEDGIWCKLNVILMYGLKYLSP